VSSRLGSAILYGVLSVVAFGGFLGAGHLAVAQGEPPALMQWEWSLVNHSTLVAWWLTWVCYPKVLIPICIVLLILAWRFPSWRARILLSIALLLLSWRGADFFQHFFERARRPDWVVKHEASFSYPSSHAAIVTGFYAFWALLLYFSDLPRAVRIISAFLLLLLSVAVCWARLALGAHYLTDILGGTLLGITFVCAAAAIAPDSFLRGGAGRKSSPAE
jgi:membrane-associated phospholipid phosphatase